MYQPSKKILDKYELGSVVEGDITGIVEFGIFIKIEEGLEGLAHISELDWGLVENPKELFKVGQVEPLIQVALLPLPLKSYTNVSFSPKRDSLLK